MLLPHIKEETQTKDKSDDVKAVNNVPYDSEQVEHFAETGTLF
jgi:hypothetical protein